MLFMKEEQCMECLPDNIAYIDFPRLVLQTVTNLYLLRLESKGVWRIQFWISTSNMHRMT